MRVTVQEINRVNTCGLEGNVAYKTVRGIFVWGNKTMYHARLLFNGVDSDLIFWGMASDVIQEFNLPERMIIEVFEDIKVKYLEYLNNGRSKE